MATADLNIPAEKLREIVREEIARRDRHDVDMLRRCAVACRNAQKQMRGRTEWFDWVPAHLDRMADEIDPEARS